MSTRSTRTIEGNDGVNNTLGNSMALSNDGNTFYYMLTGSSSYGPLYSISINGQERQLLVESDCSDLCLSPDDLHLAYRAYHPPSEELADSLYIYKIDSKEKKFLCIGRPKSFSPDSKRLLYYYSTYPDTSQYAIINYCIISIENGETEPVSFGTEVFSLHGFFWDESGLYILYNPEYGQCSVRNISTNETIFTWGENVYVYRPSYIFSTQGKKIAFWISADPIKQGLVAYGLHVIDLNLKSDTRVAYSKEKASSHSIIFSPDDSRIAYAFGDNIYLSDIP
ncbi:MAG: hypothetical protein ACFFCW_32170 [Candidatus Hodarchaeota archaeon]